MALAVRDAVIAENASFFDSYPLEGKMGPFGDDEKVGIIREILAAPREFIEADVVVRPPNSLLRHELFRENYPRTR